ncbi:MAG: nucleotide pyrophosphohydrolase [Planctomycetota bacterium]
MSTGDDATTVRELQKLVEDFVAEREWSVYHSPKNLAMSIAIEAAELMEHFQWIDDDASHAVADDPQKRAAAGEELADVVGYCLAIAGALKLDLSETVRAKMLRNHAKYPADVYRGKPSYETPGDSNHG